MSEPVGGLYYELSIDTADLIKGQREAERAFDDMAKKGDSAGKSIAASMRETAKAVQTLVISIGLASAAIAVAADEIRMMKARIDIAAGSAEDGAKAFDTLYQISKATETSMAANAAVFTRLNQSMKQLGGTTDDTLKLTDLLAKAISTSGASAVESEAAMLQFGQALGSGKLAGDELKSMMETAPYLMQQLADGIGVPIGALKKLGEDGKLTSDVVVNALGKASDKINADFEKLPPTFLKAGASMLDSAKLAAFGLDELAGTSAALTGIMRGAGQVLDFVAMQILGVGENADETARKDAIQKWAANTVQVLSYIADGADFVSRGFKQMGTLIAATAAAVGSAAAGNFAGAREIIGGLGSDLAALNSEALAGKKLRDSIASGGGKVAAPTIKGKFSALKPPKEEEKNKKSGAGPSKFDSDAYLAGLLKSTENTLDQIDTAEREALRKNAELLKEKKINAAEAEKARGLIATDYAQKRAAVAEREQAAESSMRIKMIQDEEDRIKAIRDEAIRAADAGVKTGAISAQQAARDKALAEYDASRALQGLQEKAMQDASALRVALARDAEERIALAMDETIRRADVALAAGTMSWSQYQLAKVTAMQTAEQQMQAIEDKRRADRNAVQMAGVQEAAAKGDPAAQQNLIVAAAQKQIADLEILRQADLANEQIYADRKAQIQAKMTEDLAALQSATMANALASTSTGFGAIADIMKAAAGEQSSIYKAMFAASKAFAIAEAIVKIQQGIANAAALPFPANFGAMAGVASATAGIISTIKGATFGGGRQYGGPVAADKMYRINETGQPEMFMGDDGSQYMAPNKSGRVIPADALGGGGNVEWKIIVENNANGVQVSPSVNSEERTVRIAVNEVARQLQSNSGPVWSGLRSGSNIQGRVA